MRYNTFNQFVRLRAEEDGIPEGLGSRLESFLSGGDRQEVSPPPVPGGDGAATPGDAGAGDAGGDAVDGSDDQDDDDDGGFPEFGKKPEEKKVDEFKEDEFDRETEEGLKGMGKKEGEKWKALRSELKTLKSAKQESQQAKVPAEVETELATLRQQAAEVEALRQRNKELLEMSDSIAVRESPEYIAAVTEPVKDMEDIVVKIAEASNVDAGIIFDAIMETDVAKQDQLLEGLQSKLGSRMTNRVDRLADDYRLIQRKSEEMLRDAPKHLEQRRLARDKEVAEASARRVTAFKSATADAFTQYASKIPGMTDSSGSLTDSAKSILARASTVDINSLSVEDLAYMSFAASSLPEIRRAISALEKENAILKGTRKKAKAVDGSPAGATSQSQGDDTEGLAERMRGMEFTFTAPR